MSSGNTYTQPQSNEVRKAHTNTETIRGLFERQTTGKLYDPLENPGATDALNERVREWQDNGDVVVMVFGGFDAPFHSNHQAFLFDCKAQGVATYYERHHAEEMGASWEELDDTDRGSYIEAVLADGCVRMVVSTDGDQRISGSKGFNPNKGNSPRPLLGWPSRARHLAQFTLQLGDDPRVRTPLVDAVTVHDHIAAPDTPHADPVDLVATLQPDVWALFSEAERDIAAAAVDTRLAGVELVVLDNAGYGVAADPYYPHGPSTTRLVERITGIVS